MERLSRTVKHGQVCVRTLPTEVENIKIRRKGRLEKAVCWSFFSAYFNFFILYYFAQKINPSHKCFVLRTTRHRQIWQQVLRLLVIKKIKRQFGGNRLMIIKISLLMHSEIKRTMLTALNLNSVKHKIRWDSMYRNIMHSVKFKLVQWARTLTVRNYYR